MQKRFRFSLLAAAAILILASCSKTNKQGQFIPKNAAIVFHIDGASLLSKLPWDEVKQNELFKQAYADSTVPAFVKKALDNPENTGIDIKNDLVFFTQQDSSGSYTAVTGAIKDAEKFKSFNHDLEPTGSESEDGDIKFYSKAPVCVGWNKEKFVYVYTDVYAGLTKERSRDILATCKSIFNLSEGNSLGKDEKFTALVKKSADAHFWINSEEMAKSGMSKNPMAMLSLGKLYEGSVTTGSLNFENGKIAIDIKSYVGKEMADLYKKYGDKNIDEEMIKHLPSKEVVAILSMSFKPEGIKALLQLLGVEGFANLGLSQAGVNFTLDDFIKANKGDILLAVTDLKPKPVVDTAPMHSMMNAFPPVDITFAASIADKEAFNLLIKAGEKLTAPMKADSTGMSAPFLNNFGYNSNSKYFAIGNNKTTVDQYIAGSSNNNFDFIKNINGSSFGGYVNFQLILKAMASDQRDSSDKVIHDASLKMWDNAYIKGGKFEDGGVTQSWEINLLDKNTNSLKQLNQYMGLLGKLKAERHKHETLDVTMEEMPMDNMAVPPPPPPKKN